MGGMIMFTMREVLIFFAGAEFLHTLSHLFLAYYAPLPLDFKFIVLTPSLNFWSIIFNSALTIGLLIWASRLSKSKH